MYGIWYTPRGPGMSFTDLSLPSVPLETAADVARILFGKSNGVNGLLMIMAKDVLQLRNINFLNFSYCFYH